MDRELQSIDNARLDAVDYEELIEKCKLLRNAPN